MLGTSGAHVVQVGCGNIGSHSAPMIARLDSVTKITLIDGDRYQACNVGNQAISESHVGSRKVDALAQIIDAVAPTIEVRRIGERVEDVPLAALRGDILTCSVDNRQARQYLNEAACRLGLTLVNAAVDGAMLARVDVYRASETTPCMECSWTEEQYASLSQGYPCDDAEPRVPASNSTIEVGAIAGALQTVEVRKLLSGKAEDALIGRQLMLEISSHAHHLCRFHRNPACRLDHERWAIETLVCDPATTELDGIFEVLREDASVGIGLLGHQFVTHIDCVRCGLRRSVGLALFRRLAAEQRVCDCGGRMMATGFYSQDALQRCDLGDSMRRLTMADVGFTIGDIVTATLADGRRRYVELVSPNSSDGSKA